MFFFEKFPPGFCFRCSVFFFGLEVKGIFLKKLLVIFFVKGLRLVHPQFQGGQVSKARLA